MTTRRLGRWVLAPLVAFALVPVALLPTSASTARSLVAPGATRPGPPLGGVNLTGLSFKTSFAAVEQKLAWAASLDAHSVRVEIPWSALEPRRGQIDPGALAFADHLMNRASAAGIKVVALAMSTPCWASSAPPPVLRACRPGQTGRAQAWPPSDPRAYGSFVAFLAARYGAELAAIEVWNEPDQANEKYFAGAHKAQRYAALLRAAYPAIKRADPQMPVLGGSLVGSNGAFLRALYAAGIKGYYDGLSVHFYTLVLGSLRYLHEVQIANGDNKPLWLNEFGWSSCWPRQRIQQEQGCVTEQVQATNLSNVYRALAHTPWVAAVVMYELQGTRGEDFGVLTETGAHKPAFAALRSVFMSPFGKPTVVTVHLSRRRGGIVASGVGPVGDYLQLEAFRAHRAVYRAQFTLDRFNRYRLALPRVLGTQNLRVSVFQYWMGSARAASASI
jgi:polysaccharide biosynthesis protein PslG